MYHVTITSVFDMQKALSINSVRQSVAYITVVNILIVQQLCVSARQTCAFL